MKLLSSTYVLCRVLAKRYAKIRRVHRVHRLSPQRGTRGFEVRGCFVVFSDVCSGFKRVAGAKGPRNMIAANVLTSVNRWRR